MLLKLLVALPVVILLAYISLRLGKNYMNALSKGRNIKVIETVPIHSKSFVSVVRIGKTYMVLGISEHSVSILKTLSEEEASQFKDDGIQQPKQKRYLIRRSQIDWVKGLIGRKDR